MKKIIILLGLSFIFIESPKAYMISIDHNEENYTYRYELQKYNNMNKYLLTLQKESIQIKDLQTLNNLASYYDTRDLYENVVIQKLIFETVNKDYIVKVLDDNLNVIDTKEEEKKIYSKLEEYNKKDPYDNTYYEANYGDELKFSNRYMPCYHPEGYSYTCETYYGYRITMNHETGLVKINLKNQVHREENYIYGPGMQYKEFSIFVNVHGRAVTFDIEPGTSFIFSVYNKYRYIRDIFVNERELTHYFKDEDLKFVDVSAGHYEKIGDFWVKKDETIKLRPSLRKVLVEFETHLVDIFLIDDLFKTYNDFTIYDEFNNYVTSCNEEKCNINLTVGQYFVKDNVSNLIKIKFFYEDTKDIIFRYKLDGIVSDKNIKNIKYNDIDISFTKEKNIYFFDDVIDYKYLDIYFENETKRIFFSDYDFYWKVYDFGIFYKINNDPPKIDEENKTEKPLPNEEIKKDESTKTDSPTKEINIPNTGLEKDTLIYKKEDYETHTINIDNTTM